MLSPHTEEGDYTLCVGCKQTNKEKKRSQYQPKTQFKIQTVFITDGMIEKSRHIKQNCCIISYIHKSFCDMIETIQ